MTLEDLMKIPIKEVINDMGVAKAQQYMMMKAMSSK